MPVSAQHGHALKLTVDAMVHLRVATTFHDPSGLRVVGCCKIWPAEISLAHPRVRDCEPEMSTSTN